MDGYEWMDVYEWMDGYEWMHGYEWMNGWTWMNVPMVMNGWIWINEGLNERVVVGCFVLICIKWSLNSPEGGSLKKSGQS
jgi:hypothetical protein